LIPRTIFSEQYKFGNKLCKNKLMDNTQYFLFSPQRSLHDVCCFLPHDAAFRCLLPSASRYAWRHTSVMKEFFPVQNNQCILRIYFILSTCFGPILWPSGLGH
jgi:hypothetical protein